MGCYNYQHVCNISDLFDYHLNMLKRGVNSKYSKNEKTKWFSSAHYMDPVDL